jgi:hypothetical protein
LCGCRLAFGRGPTHTRLAGGTPTAPPGWSACTTPTLARSSRAGWASRWSSATKRRSWTTPTGSCWTTRSSSAILPMRRCCARDRAGHPAGRPRPRGGHRRPQLRRGRRGRRPGRVGRAPGRHPRKGTPSQARLAQEHSRPFRRLVRWRTGSEGRISHLKHRHGRDPPGWTASTAPASGAATGCWPTTWSRSAAWSPPSSSTGRLSLGRDPGWAPTMRPDPARPSSRPTVPSPDRGHGLQHRGRPRTTAITRRSSSGSS